MSTHFSNRHDAAPTPYRVVVPFYAYGAGCLLLSTIILFFSGSEVTGHYFQPRILALTHLMAIGWATMLIIGASYQLIPVLLETNLGSYRLAGITFYLAAIGIPLLVYGFFTFNMGLPLVSGGILINLAVLSYLLNLALSVTKSKAFNIHALFIFTASLWLLLTTSLGLLLAVNFSLPVLSRDSLHFLSLHAHMGIVGWFLLLVAGVGSKLIPMFMISKHEDVRLLKWIYFLINFGLIAFVVQFQFFNQMAYWLPILAITSAVVLFGSYCYRCFKTRIRRHIDRQVRISLASVALLFLPLLSISFTSIISRNTPHQGIIMLYGTCIFFGWLTAIILGMTFKTLPFIVWNRLRHEHPTAVQDNDPRRLYDEKAFLSMSLLYTAGLLLLMVGVWASCSPLIRISAAFLIFAALIYNKSVWMMLFRKSL